MRTLVAVTAVCATALAGVVPTATAATTPKLRLVWTQPLVLRGESFKPRERVAVTALTPKGSSRVMIRASSAGRFKASLGSIGRPCGTSLGVRALGSLGSRATLRLPGVPCIPPPMD
jgi:hypothetical protein